jgi:glycosyltransferase involved in cell wall biosynthesis
VTALPQKFENAAGLPALRRMIAETYNVATNYELRGLFDIPAKFGTLEPGKWALDYDIPRYVFPYCAIMHTRDPRVLTKALAAGLTGIYEDHDEDHNRGFKKLPDLAERYSTLKLVVAITEAVRARLIKSGIPETRVIVLDSGVNSNALIRQEPEALLIRRNLLQRGFDQIILYSGGLQAERGIAHIIAAAAALPRSVFLLMGGNRADQRFWQDEVCEKALSNVLLPGYLPQRRLLAFQQAADVLLATRRHDARAAITSPLKFFEYLASGSPVVAADMPALDRYHSHGLVLTLYDPAAPDSLIPALRKSFTTHPWKAEGYSTNIAFARNFTWEQRQLALFARLTA